MDGARPELIREHRKSLGESLEVYGRRYGLSKASQSRIERGLQPIPVELLPQIVAETGIPADELYPKLAKMFAQEAAE